MRFLLRCSLNDGGTNSASPLHRIYYNGDLDGALGPASFAAIRAFRAENELPAGTAMDRQFLDTLYAKAGVEKPANARLHVRGDFAPLFEAAVAIDNPELPLGTHLVVASAGEGDTLKWSAMTLENRLSSYQRSFYGVKENPAAPSGAIAALDRIHIPPAVVQRLAEVLGAGASVAISDTGISGLTGWKTDFVVLTRLETDDGALQSNVVAKPPVRVTARKKTVKKAKPEPARVGRRPLFPLVFWPER